MQKKMGKWSWLLRLCGTFSVRGSSRRRRSGGSTAGMPRNHFFHFYSLQTHKKRTKRQQIFNTSMHLAGSNGMYRRNLNVLYGISPFLLAQRLWSFFWCFKQKKKRRRRQKQCGLDQSTATDFLAQKISIFFIFFFCVCTEPRSQ